ncbi:hypothetical protein CANMA_003580 [Candida margitis]|uniref:uncharacterized protein n=1 Tax=Candida margitis TaxID=1775924 RepID=UPI002227D742|nr:uncharacterized protein CANMA_003580 [Candida margitis]KAI5963983.1 hypothetical protein CANMA_003580 [Candida margitis]
MSELPRSRIHILLRSTEPNLHNERSLFEIHSNTTVKQLKQSIIQRLDDRQVTRTFYEQVVLSFQERVLPNDHETDESALPVALQLTNESIREMNNVIPMDLEIKSAVNGLLSREFWSDLTAEDRFDFLPIINQEAESAPSETIVPNMAVVEPMKIVAGDDQVWQLTGDSYESISNGQGITKLVNQYDISQKSYEILLNDNEKVALNTSQCIIVDNEGHQPYMLLSPAGIAKVDSVFKSQKVKVILDNSTNLEDAAEQVERPNDDILERVVATGKRVLVFAINIVFVLLILRLKPNKHIQENWIKYVVLSLVLFNIYVLFFTGENRIQRLAEPDVELVNQPPATQNFIRGIRRLAITREQIVNLCAGVQDELVAIVVSRTWDFDYIMSNQPNWYLVISSNFEHLWKDALIYLLSVSPTFQMKLDDELQKRKRSELELFQDKIRSFYDLVLSLIQDYNKKYTPNFNLPDEIELDPVLEKLENEREGAQFEFLVRYYKCLKSAYDVFNGAYVKHKSLSNEQVELLNNEFNSFIGSRN